MTDGMFGTTVTTAPTIVLAAWSVAQDNHAAALRRGETPPPVAELAERLLRRMDPPPEELASGPLWRDTVVTPAAQAIHWREIGPWPIILILTFSVLAVFFGL